MTKPAAVGGVQVCACDFQWTGRGLPMQDVAYLLWTSVAPAVVRQHEDELLQGYILDLQAQLQARGVNASDDHVHVSDACSGSGGGRTELHEARGVGSARGLSLGALRHQYEVWCFFAAAAALMLCSVMFCYNQKGRNRVPVLFSGAFALLFLIWL